MLRRNPLAGAAPAEPVMYACTATNFCGGCACATAKRWNCWRWDFTSITFWSYSAGEMASVNFRVRLLLVFLVGVLGLGASIAVAYYIKIDGAGVVLQACILLVAAAFTGYCEPLAKRVWIHPVLLTLPLAVALAYGALTCKGHGCAGFAVFAVMGSLVTLVVLIAVSFTVFFIRRRFS